MTIEDALALFQDVPAVAARLGLLAEVGLGYLQLGQPATTSRAARRSALSWPKTWPGAAKGHTLYLLDEPTTGLHPADVARLLAAAAATGRCGQSAWWWSSTTWN